MILASYVVRKILMSVSIKMYYLLPTKILQEADTANGTVLQKVVLEFLVKMQGKYTNKKCLKDIFLRILITIVTIV